MMGKMVLTEVCIETPDDARAAAAGGADRLELCRDLSVGGLTPDLALLREVVAATSLPVLAMLRCRAGDFHYSEAELAEMEAQVAPLLDAGASGIVFGAVDAEGMPDPAALHRIRAAIVAAPASATPRPTPATTRRELVFHRAFDIAPDQAAALESLIHCKVHRVLTSGHPDGVTHGLERLATLLTQAGQRITVMPGGGIRPDNAAALAALPGLREVHFSARATATDRTEAARVRALADAARLASQREATGEPGRSTRILGASLGLCMILVGFGSGCHYKTHVGMGWEAPPWGLITLGGGLILLWFAGPRRVWGRLRR